MYATPGGSPLAANESTVPLAASVSTIGIPVWIRMLDGPVISGGAANPPLKAKIQPTAITTSAERHFEALIFKKNWVAPMEILKIIKKLIYIY